MNKEQLRQYRWLIKEIELLQAEITRMRGSIQSVQMPDGMPRGSEVGDRVGKLVERIVDAEAVLHSKMREAIEISGRIEEHISRLLPEQRVLMRLRYIEGHAWENICVELHYGWAQIHRKHSEALQAIGKHDTQ